MEEKATSNRNPMANLLLVAQKNRALLSISILKKYTFLTFQNSAFTCLSIMLIAFEISQDPEIPQIDISKTDRLFEKEQDAPEKEHTALTP